LEDAPLAYLHVFSYSPRKHTLAARMPGQVNPRQTKERSLLLRRLSESKTEAFYRSFVGSEVEVLVETSEREGRLSGRTDNYVRVEFEGPDSLMGHTVVVRLTEANGQRAVGVQPPVERR